MSEKVIGYTLLTIGILTIIFSVFNVFQVFTRQIKPVQLFNLPAPKIDIQELISASLPEGLALLPKSKSNQELISAELINEPFNVTAHLFLMGFIGSAGYKLASLGIMLIRPIVVKLKEATNK